MSQICPAIQQNIVGKPRIAVAIAVMNGGETGHKSVNKYHGLLIHSNRGFVAVPAVHVVLGLIVTGYHQAETDGGHTYNASDKRRSDVHGHGHQ